ncbi:hypothetical protein ACOSP7_004723 [Xanthoceras sorbifolium]
MQSIKLPSEVCYKLDKINRNFLWGHTTDKKTVHLINWDTVCNPKNEGGLGIMKIKVMNQALLAKAGWRLLQGEVGLWGQLLKKKYLKYNTAGDISTNKYGASIGKGDRIRFWTDLWITDLGTLQQYATGNLDQDQLSKQVSWFLEEGNWNVEKLATNLPWVIVHKICSTCTDRTGNAADRQIWGLEKDGVFSVKSAYKVACKVDSLSKWDWSFIWKLRIPPKLSHFLWLVCHGKILTNLQRNIRGISNDASCPRCNFEVEDMQHLFRNCSTSSIIWEDVSFFCRNSDLWQGGRATDFKSWLYGNLNSSAIDSNINHPLFNLISECRKLIKSGWNCEVKHILREGNMVADFLAGLGKHRELGTSFHPLPPPEIASLIELDAGNILFVS